jgi:hypothetical protein
MTTSSKQDFLGIAAGSALAPIKFGLGGVPFGNEFEVVSDEDAYKTVTIKYRWARGDYARLPGYVDELIGQKINLLTALGGDASARAAQGGFISSSRLCYGRRSGPGRPGAEL